MIQQNPSRAAEDVARNIVQQWVADRGRVKADSGHGPDFHIAYEDGRSAIGEVKVDFDEQRQEQWNALLRLPVAQTVALPTGSGTWMATVAPRASIKRLKAAMPGAIQRLADLGLTEFDTRFSRTPSEIVDGMQLLGIEQISAVNSAVGDKCVLFTQTAAGMVPLNADSAIPWLVARFADPRFTNSWRRLGASTANERHVFMWIESGAPAETLLRVSFHPETPPTRAPLTPNWLTHLWVGIPSSFADGSWTWLYQPTSGWQALSHD